MSALSQEQTSVFPGHSLWKWFKWAEIRCYGLEGGSMEMRLSKCGQVILSWANVAGVSMQTWKVAYRGMCLSCYIKHCSFQQHLSVSTFPPGVLIWQDLISCSSSVQDTTQLHTHLLCPRGFSCRSIITNLCRVNKQCLTLHNFSILLELKCFTLI